MISAIFAIHAFLSMPPKQAARLFNKDLVPICHRESRCTRKGVHRIDGHLGKSAYRKAVARGLLKPEQCPFHAPRANASEWSTSGPFGMIRAYSLQYLPWDCVPPEVLDIPVVAAYVANERYKKARTRRAPLALKRWARLIPLLSESRAGEQP